MHGVRATVVTLLVGAIAGGLFVAQVQRTARAQKDLAGVTGIGGVFFKAEDPASLRQWYEDHLGIDAGPEGVNFFWRDREDPSSFGLTVWAVFPVDTGYFGREDQQFMVNYRVADLDAMLARLRAENVPQLGATEEYWYGRFAWIQDGEGNRVELWEPVDVPPEEFERRAERSAD